MDTAQAKQQVVERLKQANNILVTVSNNPSVDQLAACIGMTLFLNKLEKHATAVFSGKVPNTIEFLQPEKTLEPTTDSLRDFIISLDKAKADKLRYKVEDKFVRIYITPYRTSISEKDLVFSEGDFNVDVVLALGVRERTQLDAAITAHGRILHDATVVSVNAGAEKAPQIGQINWQEPSASSLCEMLVSISEAFGTGLIDGQMATAFLTGIVAETDRFSNTKTSPKVMTMSAQLMAAGANQQLIVSKLEPPPPPEAAKPVKSPKMPPEPPSDTLSISHEEGQQDGAEVEVNPDEIHIDAEGNIIPTDQPKAELPPLAPVQLPEPRKVEAPPPPLPPPPPPPPPVPPHVVEPPVPPPPPELPKPEPTPAPPIPVEPPKPEPVAAMNYEPLISEPPALAKPEPPTPHVKPMLNLPEPLTEAKAPEQPRTPKPHELLDPHDHKPTISSAFSADTQPEWFDLENSTPNDPLGEEHSKDEVASGHVKDVKPPSSVFPPTEDPSLPTFAAPELTNARGAVNAALATTPFNPAIEGPVAALNAQPMGSELHPPTPTPPPVEKPAPEPKKLAPEKVVPPIFSGNHMDERPAPPPVPPPLKLDSGAIIPTSPNPEPEPIASSPKEPTLALPKIL